MLMRHCNVNTEPSEVWFLKDIEFFTNRILLIGKCDICKKDIITLIEVRKKDNIPFVNVLSGQKAIKVKTTEKKRIDYTLSSLNQQSSSWVYGVNVGIKNKNGDVTQVRQYAADFNGKRKIVKRIIV
jgi:hypothetical protein